MMFMVIDVSYLMHRAFHVMGDLAHGGEMTGALFGFFRDIQDLQDLLAVDRIAFACDYGHTYRSELLPSYKEKRHTKERSEEEQEARKELQRQISALRDKWLPMCGYRNVFKQPGVEADDLVAMAVKALPADSEAVIVSADSDLWQLVREGVWCYNPTTRKATTHTSFQRDWGIPPALWPNVKALAGDTSDEIPGIPGIGLKSAAAWYARKLKACAGKPKKDGSPCKCKRCLIERNLTIHNDNVKLTRIPCPGVDPVHWREDEWTDAKWLVVAERLGFASLVGRKGKQRA